LNIQFPQLKVPKATLESILDFLPYPFIQAETKAGAVLNTYLNKRFIEEIGHELHEIPSIEHWFEVAYPDWEYRQYIQKKWMEMTREAEISGKSFIIAKAKIYTKRNGYKWFEVKASLFGEGQQFVSFVNIDEVIKKEEELIKANENKNKMLSILSHDLRSSMINLYSLSNMASNEKLTHQEFTELALQVKEKSSKTIELLDTTVQWTRNNFEHVKLKLEPVPVPNTVKEILSMDESYIIKQIKIKQNLDQDAWPITDRGVLTIIIRNLISNAIKFTPSGGEIEVHSRMDENEFCFSVKDTGIGMDIDLVNSLVSDQYTPSIGTMQEKGSGVGLTLCRDLLKKINGTLDIQSTPRKGTQMVITLPCR
jgi:signal transduction histidine kinase